MGNLIYISKDDGKNTIGLTIGGLILGSEAIMAAQWPHMQGNRADSNVPPN